MRIRHESLAAAARAGKNVEANRATLQEAGGTAAKGRASDLPTGPLAHPNANANANAKDASSSPPAAGIGPESEGDGGEADSALAGIVAVEELGMVQSNAGSEEWLNEVICFFTRCLVLCLVWGAHRQ